MKRIKLIPIIVLIFLSTSCQEGMEEKAVRNNNSEAVVKYLRCEYRVNPLGVDAAEPRLSWILESNQRGQAQIAYQILVASSKDNLTQNNGNLWDSGKVESDRSNQIVYKGKPLKSRIRCYWKLRIWDKDGKASDWSEPAFWTVGLLESEDWKAQWISFNEEPSASYLEIKEPDPLSLTGCKWVWYPEGQPNRRVPNVTRFFRRKIEIPPDRKISRAQFRLAADNNAILYINSRQAHQFSGWQRPFTFDITDKIIAGTNIFAFSVTNTGGSASPAGLAGKLVIDFAASPPMIVPIDSSWKTSQKGDDGWQNEDFEDQTWVNVKETANCGDMPWGNMEDDALILPPPPYFRKDFVINKPVKRATVYATALGLYELQINGSRIGRDYFTPSWTDYKKRLYYQSYDVTNSIIQGGNAIGAILADGWYAGHLGSRRRRGLYGSDPSLLVQLEIEYEDGSRNTVSTDGSWKAAYGPIVEADFLMGEFYDNRKEIPGWAGYGLDDTDWHEVTLNDKWSGTLKSYPGVTVQKNIELGTKKITEPKKGMYVFDMDQNFAGWARLKVKGKAGTKVVLRYAEMLNPDGTIYTTNLRQARCTDTYILKGDGEEIWEPRFTYHGFRYVEVTGYPGKPKPDAITGVVVHSNTPPVGSFECSNPMVNQLYSNIVWSQRSNFIEVPTDCPQRDERLGWTGDAQIFIRTATYNMDVAAFFTKWLVDLEDAQSNEGAFSDVAPRITIAGDGTAAWGDAGVICPWTIYEVYGDKRVIEKHYDSMKKWIAYLKKNSKDLLRPARGYGDWVSIASDTPKDVIATAYFAYSTRLLSKMATAIGNNDDAEKYEKLFQQIKDAFNKAYVSEDARIKGQTQTCYVLGLHFDLLPEDKREAAAEHLAEAIRKKNWHLSTGFVGLSYLLPALTETGQLDIAYRLLTNDTFPSWGYSIKNGATSIWERWDGWTEDKGFQNPGMNSFNHYSFGAVGRWLFGTVAGIDTDGPGYKKIIIRPRPGEIKNAKASYESIHGKIVSDWRLRKGSFTLNVTIPANTTATIYVPAGSADSVTESGQAAAEAQAVQFLRMEQGNAVFAIGSGHYKFVSKLP